MEVNTEMIESWPWSDFKYRLQAGYAGANGTTKYVHFIRQDITHYCGLAMNFNDDDRSNFKSFKLGD